MLHVIGAGGYASCILDVAYAANAYIQVRFYDRKVSEPHRHLGGEVVDEALIDDVEVGAHVMVALGDNYLRQRVVERISANRHDLVFPVLVHPAATVSQFAAIGPGTVVMAGAAVGPNARVGSHVSLYTHSVIEHDSVAEDFVTLAPGAKTGGSVVLGERTFLGLGATVNHGLRLGADTIVGAGAAVTKSVDGKVMLAGVPARVLRDHRPGHTYL